MAYSGKAKYTRTNVYASGGDFSDPTVLWYARGVEALKKRKLADPTGWRFYGAIHGIYDPLWRLYGYLPPGDPKPSQAQQDLFWKQCQHGSWYFLPWHRGYLLAFEATVRAAIVDLKGPADWALPYWNYFGPNDQFKLPPAFATPDWPDGTGNNPLFVKQRYGPNNDGNVYVPLSEVNLDALTVPEFTDVPVAGGGFGGVDTGFEHGGPVHGRLETQPHDWVHGLVGGGNPTNPNLPGLMSDPDTAGLDPIFWLHHANIDRLWETWIREPTSEGNPTESKWVDGPASIGEHVFVMPLPPDGTPWEYTPGQMADLAKLDYTYDDFAPAGATPAIEERLESLRAPARAALAAASAEGVAPMATTRQPNVELVGASESPLRVAGFAPVHAAVQLDQEATQRVSASLNASMAEGLEAAPPDRVFLNLENVRGLSDATAFQVYVNVPAGENPLDHPDRLAGNVALFGVRKATAADEEHGGQGLTFVLEITKIVDSLHQESALEAGALDVRIVPIKEVPEEAHVTIGRVSVFRKGR